MLEEISFFFFFLIVRSVIKITYYLHSKIFKILILL